MDKKPQNENSSKPSNVKTKKSPSKEDDKSKSGKIKNIVKEDLLT